MFRGCALCLSVTVLSYSSAFGAVFQGSLFGLAGILPASYTTPIMSGQGLAGAFAAFSMICALASRCQLGCLPEAWRWGAGGAGVLGRGALGRRL